MPNGNQTLRIGARPPKKNSSATQEACQEYGETTEMLKREAASDGEEQQGKAKSLAAGLAMYTDRGRKQRL